MASFMKALAMKKAATGPSDASATIQSNVLSSPKTPFVLEDIVPDEMDSSGKLKELLKHLLDSSSTVKNKVTEVETKMATKFMAIEK